MILKHSFANTVRQIPAALLLLLLAWGCSKDEPESPPLPVAEAQRTVLIYAVATNSLSYSLSGDIAEMRVAASSIAGLGERINVLLYRIDYSSGPALYELDAETADFKLLKKYDRSQFSTDPERISDVIGDAVAMRPANKYGLVMWSHATGWTPDFSTHSHGVKRSFGQDKDGGVWDSIDIDALAEVIPSGVFDYIWWDCCYMGSIEVAYQFRDKSDYMVAAVSEVPGDGMPYHITLPLLARETPLISDAANEYYEYYHRISENKDLRDKIPATIAVYDMSRIENVAEAAARIYASGEVPREQALQNYARRPCGPFYDFGQYTRLYSQAYPEGEPLRIAFDAAMDKFVVTSRCTPYNFHVWSSSSYTDPNVYTWDTDIFSGITCHYPDPSTVAEENYYRSLDWWKRVKGE
ncbi:MAG: hypothetical protein K2O24_06785 [Muribaculaceae bacterium]|nr:hypothetical protein [Muribaculaceae bacterium]